MVGRLIQNNPFCLSKADKLFFNHANTKKKRKNNSRIF